LTTCHPSRPRIPYARNIACTIPSLRDWIKQHRQKNPPLAEQTSFIAINVIDRQQHFHFKPIEQYIVVQVLKKSLATCECSDLGRESELQELLPDEWKKEAGERTLIANKKKRVS
jgi:hypothetical protein